MNRPNEEAPRLVQSTDGKDDGRKKLIRLEFPREATAEQIATAINEPRAQCSHK